MENFAECSDIEQRVLNLIRYYTRKFYSLNVSLRAHGVTMADIESDVCYYIYKTNKKGETFIDKMRKIKTEKHLRAFVKLSVNNMIGTYGRSIKNKPIAMSLDYLEEDQSTEFVDLVVDSGVNVETEALFKIAINAIPNKRYKDLYFVVDGEKHRLARHLLIKLILMKCGKESLYGVLYRTDKKGKLVKLKSKEIITLLERVKSIIIKYLSNGGMF